MPDELEASVDILGDVTHGAPTEAPPQAPAPAASGTPADAPAARSARAEEAKPAAKQRFFPLPSPPLANFRTGARNFGAGRSGGRRLHAGVDLIAPVGTKIRAIADGVVIQAPYYFYSGTNALEVDHPGIGVVRYGEISISKAVRLKAGDRVKAGEVIAYVGRLESGSSMLHFELYSGKAKGALSVGQGPYMRRRDLINPSTLIDELARRSFGK